MTPPLCCKKLPRRNKNKKTIYECFKPILQVSVLGGMCTVKAYKNSYVLSQRLIGLQVFTILLNVTHLVIVPYGITYLEEHSGNSSKDLNDTNDIPERHDFIVKMANPMLVSLSTLILRLLNLMLLHRNLPIIFRKIENAKRVVNFRDTSYKDNMYAVFLVTWMLLLSVPFQIFSVLEEIPKGAKNATIKVIIFAFNHYNNLSAFCLDIQFSYMCYILKNRFQIINNNLRKNENLEAVASINKNMFIWKYETEKQLKVIQDLKYSHRKLCEGCEHLNTLYSTQLLIILSSCLINVLLNFYFAIYGWFDSESSQSSGHGYSRQPIEDIIKQVTWGFYYFVRFFGICAMAEKLLEEANMTKILICNLLGHCTDKNINDVLWKFHAYTVSNKIKFTGSGFFRIDLRLISSAISAGTTYLVILAQFHGQNH